jgi:hypothetical protein
MEGLRRCVRESDVDVVLMLQEDPFVRHALPRFFEALDLSKFQHLGLKQWRAQALAALEPAMEQLQHRRKELEAELTKHWGGSWHWREAGHTMDLEARDGFETTLGTQHFRQLPSTHMDVVEFNQKRQQLLHMEAEAQSAVQAVGRDLRKASNEPFVCAAPVTPAQLESLQRLYPRKLLQEAFQLKGSLLRKIVVRRAKWFHEHDELMYHLGRVEHAILELSDSQASSA